MRPTTGVQGFACRAFSARITVDQCVRYRAAALSASKAPRTALRVVNAECRACPVGNAHATGAEPTMWPDGAPVVRVEIVTALPMSAAHKAASLIRPKPKRMTRKRVSTAPRYTWGERTLTCGEWASEPECIAAGLTREVIRSRLEKCSGWTIEDALTTPKRAARPERAA